MKIVPCMLIFGCFLLGCSDNPSKASSTRAERDAARLANAEQVLKTPPTHRTYQVESGELRVFELPTKDSMGFLETQHCFVWRDTEFKSASINCSSSVNEPLLSKTH